MVKKKIQKTQKLLFKKNNIMYIITVKIENML